MRTLIPFNSIPDLYELGYWTRFNSYKWRSRLILLASKHHANTNTNSKLTELCRGEISQKYHDELVGKKLVSEMSFDMARTALLCEALVLVKDHPIPCHEHIVWADDLIPEEIRLQIGPPSAL